MSDKIYLCSSKKFSRYFEKCWTSYRFLNSLKHENPLTITLSIDGQTHSSEFTVE